MNTITPIRLKAVKNAFKYTAEANYYLAILISFAAAIMAMSGNENFLNTGEDFYNPLINNLKIMLAYMLLAEFSVFGFCLIKRSYTELAIVGLFLLFIPSGLKFYAQINQLEIDHSFDIFFLYTGLSHIFYGLLWKR
ncbi:MAG: hypothetical protein IBX55_14225 [Methyloprofundus sp.]|nr:hypothetical protein [Methyloprofundus sp.]MBW6452491.1 hypothetical protein [Methyloprofundus sp.]